MTDDYADFDAWYHDGNVIFADKTGLWIEATELRNWIQKNPAMILSLLGGRSPTAEELSKTASKIALQAALKILADGEHDHSCLTLKQLYHTIWQEAFNILAAPACCQIA